MPDTNRALLALCPAFVAAGAIAVALQDNALKLELDGATKSRLGYMPIRVALSPEKPRQIKKEPSYRTTPNYTTIKVGNGPKSTFVIAVDEPAGADFKIYIDKNQNGDLTDDGDGAWPAKRDNNGRIMYGTYDVTLRASYGSSGRETSSSDYGISLYRFVGQDYLLMYRRSARMGTVTVDGKAHQAMLIENDADGVYNKTAKDATEAAKSKPVWLRIDINDDGKFASGMVDARAPFKIGDQAYEAKISADGAKVVVERTTKPVVSLTPKAPPRPPLLATGTPAPDFVSEKWGGGTLKLSDYIGKVVVLDFWATWCGPCQRSMPHLEEVYKAVKDQDVVVIALCVWDDKAAYEKWVPQNQSKYSYQFAFDPAGRGDSSKSIAGKLFNVSGIPTTYIIDKNGKVVEGVVGYQDGDKRVEAALKKAGVKID